MFCLLWRCAGQAAHLQKQQAFPILLDSSSIPILHFRYSCVLVEYLHIEQVSIVSSVRMQKPNPGGWSPVASTATFLSIPAELRLATYNHLFSDIAATLGPRLLVEYHICDKTHEVTIDINRFHGQVRTTELTPMFRTCKTFHEEALPLLYNHVKFIVSLRPSEKPLHLSPVIRDQFAHAKLLALTISVAIPCQSVPNSEVKTRKRRNSWDGGSSVTTNDPARDAPGSSTRTRSNSWAGPAPTRMCFITYLRRLDALLQAFNHGENLRVLAIYVTNTDQRLTAQDIELILRHIEAGVKVGKKCYVVLYLDRQTERLVSHDRIGRFLHQIQ